MLTIALIAVAFVLVAGALWLWHEARVVARPEYAEYNERMDAADRFLDGARGRAGLAVALVAPRATSAPTSSPPSVPARPAPPGSR